MKKTQVKPDVNKHYLYVAKERLEHVFSVRPEWRKPATARELDFIIENIDENYYPFSDKKNPKRSIWHRLLLEKREEMAAELKERNKANPKNITGDIKSGSEARRDAATTQEVGKRDPEGETGRALPFTKPEHFAKYGIQSLKKDIRAARCGSRIARELNLSPSYIGMILGKEATPAMKRRIPIIYKVFHEIRHNPRKIVDARDLTNGAHEVPGINDHLKHAPAFPLSKMKPVSDLFELPQPRASLISSLTANIKNGQLHVYVVVDADTAFQMYKERHASISGDEIKITME